MPRLILSTLALAGLLAPAALAQTVPADTPVPIVIPAPDGAATEITPEPVTPVRKTGCGRDRSVMS